MEFQRLNLPKIPYKKTKYSGVYEQHLLNNDISYSIVYRDENNVQKRKNLGRRSQGITPLYCENERAKTIENIKNNIAIPINVLARKKILTFRELVDDYFDDKIARKILKDNISDKRDHIEESKHIIIRTFDVLLDRNVHKLLENDFFKCIDSKNAQSTKIKQINTAKAILKFGLSKNLILQNVLENIKLAKANNRRVRYLTLDEIHILLARVKHDSQLYLFVLLALSTGARLQTICNIQKKDLNLKGNNISLFNFKSSNWYEGYVTDEIKELIKSSSNDYVLLRNTLFHRIPYQIQDKLQPILNQLFNVGLDTKDARNRVVIHTLRHTFASHLAINNNPIFTIMKLLDHKDIKDTLIYAELSPDNKKSAVLDFMKDITQR